MRKILLAVAASALLTGCVSPNWIRLIPENKDAHITLNTVYGTLTIDTRVNPNGTNGLGPVTATAVPANSVILTR